MVLPVRLAELVAQLSAAIKAHPEHREEVFEALSESLCSSKCCGASIGTSLGKLSAELQRRGIPTLERGPDVYIVQMERPHAMRQHARGGGRVAPEWTPRTHWYVGSDESSDVDRGVCGARSEGEGEGEGGALFAVLNGH